VAFPFLKVLQFEFYKIQLNVIPWRQYLNSYLPLHNEHPCLFPINIPGHQDRGHILPAQAGRAIQAGKGAGAVMKACISLIVWISMRSRMEPESFWGHLSNS